MNNIEIILPLLIGFILDCLIGDPHRLPHPIRLFGNLIAWGEKTLNQVKSVQYGSLPINSKSPGESNGKKLKGAIMALTLILSTFFFFWFLLKLISGYEYLYLVICSVFVFYGLANRSLIQESWKVISVLKKDGIEAGRKQLSMIVGRETTKLNAHQIRTAVLETLAENLSDGVIAPLFFYALGGVPAMLAYKMANTLDSMIGYKSKRYKDFGMFAAKLDDVLNWIPARLTAIFMVLVTFSWRGVKFIFKYGRKHSSPNAGYPEAALAGILNCRFGGPNIYHGVLVEKPFIGKNNRNVSDKDIIKACSVNFFTALVFIVLIVVIYTLLFL